MTLPVQVGLTVSGQVQNPSLRPCNRPWVYCSDDAHCRWGKDYEACYLDDLPHRRLTHPKKVFEYFFEGDRRGRGRDNIVKLDIVEPGVVNAIAFWFDLHMDDVESITNGEHQTAFLQGIV